LKPHKTLKDSLSIHLKRFIDTSIPFIPTSKNAIILNKVVNITQLVVIICAPVIPTFLPKKPDTIEPNKGKIIKDKYIIYIVLLYFLLIYKMLLKYLDLLQILLQL